MVDHSIRTKELFDSGFPLVQLIKFFMVEKEIWGSIFAYTKNRLVFWSNDKELSLKADVISWNSLKKRKRKRKKKMFDICT